VAGAIFRFDGFDSRVDGAMSLPGPLARFLAMRHLGNRATVVLVRAATAADRLQAAVIRAFFELPWKRRQGFIAGPARAC
jgi:hypothetical protein